MNEYDKFIAFHLGKTDPKAQSHDSYYYINCAEQSTYQHKGETNSEDYIC